MTTNEIYDYLKKNDISNRMEIMSLIADLALSQWKQGFNKAKEIYKGAEASS